MKILHKLNKALSNPSLLLLLFLNKTAKIYPDRFFLKLKFRLMMGQKLNLKNPQTFNEKLQWLKLYNRKPEYTTMVDKYAVKEYVASKIGDEYIIPTLGVWDSPEDIEWDSLPNQFVLKTTHGGGGGGVVICKDKSQFDKESAIRRLKKSLAIDLYVSLREWPYKNVQKRIIAEKYMSDSCVKRDDLPDYKFYCFDGEPRFVMVANGRFEGDTRFDYFDMNWSKLPLVWGKPNSDIDIPKPGCFEDMKRICRKLTKGIPHVRCDLYIIGDKTFFGELTFFDASGLCKFENEDWNIKIGDLINLPVSSRGG